MKEETCSTCSYFKQHYTLDERRILRVFCGHCTFARPKTKRPYAKVCKNYIKSDADEKLFVSKEYLSKALLEYVLRLELLPPIQNSEWEKE